MPRGRRVAGAPGDRDRQDDDRRADRDDDRAGARPVGMLDDDAVQEAREVECGARHRDRRQAPEHAHHGRGGYAPRAPPARTGRTTPPPSTSSPS